MFKKLWNDPVWSKVIAGAILAAGAIGCSYFLNWWPTIGTYTSKTLAFSVETSKLPNWVIGALVLGVIPTVLLVGVVTWVSLHPEKESVPDWSSYTTDMFHGMRWRWNYLGHSLGDMHTFCPKCDFQVFPYRDSAYAVVDRISFRCDSCHSSLGSFDEPWDSLESKTRRLVQQKLRNNSWQTPA
jgi:hypothetical protein